MNNPTPLAAIEVLFVFAAALWFGWWQLRSVRRDQAAAAAERRRAAIASVVQRAVTRAEDPLAATQSHLPVLQQEPSMTHENKANSSAIDTPADTGDEPGFRPLDPGRIQASDPIELRYWCGVLQCDEDTLRHAVANVGEHVTEVRQFLAQRR